MEKTEKIPLPFAIAFLVLFALLVSGALLYFDPFRSTDSETTNEASIIYSVYTTGTVNVRSCASVSCNSLGTYPPNTDIPVLQYSVTDISKLPDWVSFSFTTSDGSATMGYIKTSVLSGKVTPSDTPALAASGRGVKRLTREQIIENIEAMEQQGAAQQEVQGYLDSLKGGSQSPPSQQQSVTQTTQPSYQYSGEIVVANQTSQGAIKSSIDGEFTGWDGETLYKLMDGQYWQQSTYYYYYYYAYNPTVLIYSTNGGYKMHVEGAGSEDVSVIPVSGVIESRIKGEFKGWEGETVYELTNGQIWQQSSYHYHYHYAYQPQVLIYRSGGGYKMHVKGDNDKEISVRRLQ